MAGTAAGGAPQGTLGPWMLNVRLERPVEGCLITPHAYLYQKGEKGAQAAREREKFIYTYRWLRGPERPVCANPSCPRAQSFNPLQWSKVRWCRCCCCGGGGGVGGCLNSRPVGG
jgi:hypothetical protein